MIKLKIILELKQPFISAASGLLKLRNKFYVIADDENFLAIYDPRSDTSQAISIFQEQLPSEKKERKKRKKDFEAIVYLPLEKKILIVPSGSTPDRYMGALLSEVGRVIQPFSFKKLYESLNSISELNIEGAMTDKEDLILLQRGNGTKGLNAIIILNLKAFLNQVDLTPKIIPVQLGEANGIKLSFTDGAMAEGNILFLAVAEDSSSTYLDGEIKGAVLGLMTKQGRVLTQMPLLTSSKPEGLSYTEGEDKFYVVMDDDNRQIPSNLFEGFLPLEWRSFSL